MSKNYRAALSACLGDPVDGNPTGVMQEAAFAACGLNWRYLTIRVKDGQLPQAFAGMKAMDFSCCNLTMPHKRTIIPLLDGLTQAAQIIGAVNTVFRDGDRWMGENTDGKGFVRALLKEGISPEGKRVTILGAGGAARAISVECALAGASAITVINRSRNNGTELVDLINAHTPAQAHYLLWAPAMPIPENTDILVNATCVGLHPNVTQKPDIDYATILPQMVVCDVVFNPVDPVFLQKARKQGAKTVSGIGMLVQQGALAFTLWTGKDAPEQIMYDTLANEFAE